MVFYVWYTPLKLWLNKFGTHSRSNGELSVWRLHSIFKVHCASTSKMTEFIKVSSENDVIDKLCLKIEEIAANAIKNRSKFRIGLSGGSLTKHLSIGLPKIKTDWGKWELFFCDERFVDENNSDSTFGVYKRDLLPKLGDLKEDQFVTIDTQVSLNQCAIDYENKIKRSFNLDDNDTTIPVFDLLLLGMGPDGHTCSLFPEHPLLKVVDKLIVPIDNSPKPPPKRVTMTYPIVNNSNFIIFSMAGAGKAEMIKRILVDKEPLPAALVKPTHGKLIWILDEAAGLHLKL